MQDAATPQPASNQDVHFQAYDVLYNAFFSKQNIKHTLQSLLETHTVNDNDFLTQLLGVMCSHTVQYVFTEHGFTPFDSMPLVIVPYSKMTRKQLLAINEVLDQPTCDSVNIKVSSLMGGGSCVNLTCVRRRVIDAVDVLVALHGIITQCAATHNKLHVDTSATFNLILQRLVCSIGLPRAQILHVRDSILAAQAPSA